MAGSSHKYLLILSRTSSIHPDTLIALITQAQEMGFDTDTLYYPLRRGNAAAPLEAINALFLCQTGQENYHEKA